MSYSIRRYTGTGAPQVLDVPPYLDQSHIKVYVAGVLSTSWSWVTSATLTITAPVGATVAIQRSTSPGERLTDYLSGVTLTENDLDQDSLQAFYLAQESKDIAEDILGFAAAPLDTSIAAAVAANASAAAAASSAAAAAASLNVRVLSADLASTADATKGAGLAGYLSTLAYAANTVGWALLKLVRSATAAETAAGVTVTDKRWQPGDVRRYGALLDGTTNDTVAFQASINQAKQAGGAPAYWPEGTARVSSILLSGSNYRVITSGPSTVLYQTAGNPEGTPIIVIRASNIEVGDVTFIGNIASDTGEWNHCISIYDDTNTVADIRNVKMGRLYGTNIRGDVLYVGGLVVRPTYNITFESISGSNVIRNLLSVVGGHVYGKAVINNGPVGYKDIDVEPNPGGIYQPSVLKLDFVRAGIFNVVSADTALENESVIIGHLDLDQTRVLPTTPVYAFGPDSSPQGLSISYCKYFKCGYLKMRNYNYIPVTFGASSLKCHVFFDVVDIANCCKTETTYKALFADLGAGGCGSLTINVLNATLFSTAKRCFTGAGWKVRVRSGTVSGGALANTVPGGVFENLTVNGSSTSDLMVSLSDGVVLRNCAFTGTTLATLLYQCPGAMLQQVTGTFATVFTVNSDNVLAIGTTLNGIRYINEVVGSNSQSKCGTATFAGGTTKAVTFATAEGDANYKVCITAGANKTFWVTSKGTGGFTLNASATSSDTVDWFLFR